jgi:biotin synthase-like enzyme
MENLLSLPFSIQHLTLMFLLNFQVEVIINMFIKREPTPYKEHEVNSPYSTSNFRD